MTLQPMNTAPTDGTEILAWCPDDGGWFVVWMDRWTKKWRWTSHNLRGDDAIRPTRWCHLPEAPEDDE